MKTIYYTATSLDGFLATPDDSVDFLDESPKPSEDTYTPFIQNVGAIAMGRSTYAFLLRHLEAGGEWPYAGIPTWVFTHHDLPAQEGVTFASGAVTDAFPAMQAAAGGKDVWVCGGGDLAGQFLDAGLLDELVITVASRTLGAGKPLLPRDAPLKLTSARALGEGFAELRYVPVGREAA